MIRALACLALVGCAGDFASDSAPPGDGCGVGLSSDPLSPVAGPNTMIRVRAHVFLAPGVLSYQWQVQLKGTAVAFEDAQPDRSEIGFLAEAPGTYRVTVEVTGSPQLCTPTTVAIDVRPPGSQRGRLRVRVVPPADVAPPLEQRREVDGGASANLGVISVERGLAVSALVRGPSGIAPAYVRFAPSAAPDAVVEVFAGASGMIATRLSAQPHSVVVIPASPSVAPGRITGWSSTAALDHIDIAAGRRITGTVHGPSGGGLGGATVQLTIDGVPSTVARTAAGGGFELFAMAGTAVTVEVTPPDGSGLPRLTASSRDFDLAAGLAIDYAPALATRDLDGMLVTRGGGAVARAQLMVVGSLVAVGTVTAGTSADAAGEVRIAASAGTDGRLPRTLVPAGALSAVVTVAPGDLAVAALDTTVAAPVAIDAPAMAAVTTAIQDADAAGLPGALLDAVPVGALAMAAAPALHVTAGGAGAVTLALASGGHYELRFRDPARRAAALVLGDRDAATIAAQVRLPAALHVTGTLLLGGTQPLAGAAVQILCDDCTGIARAKPIAEGVSNAAGVFSLPVPDPGVK